MLRQSVIYALTIPEVKLTCDSILPLRLIPACQDKLLRLHVSKVLRSLKTDAGVRTDNDHSFVRKVGMQRRRIEILSKYASDVFAHGDGTNNEVRVLIGICRDIWEIGWLRIPRPPRSYIS